MRNTLRLISEHVFWNCNVISRSRVKALMIRIPENASFSRVYTMLIADIESLFSALARFITNRMAMTRNGEIVREISNNFHETNAAPIKQAMAFSGSRIAGPKTTPRPPVTFSRSCVNLASSLLGPCFSKSIMSECMSCSKTITRKS